MNIHIYHHKNKLHFKLEFLIVFLYQINAALVNIRDFQKHKKTLTDPEF